MESIWQQTGSSSRREGGERYGYNSVRNPPYARHPLPFLCRAGWCFILISSNKTSCCLSCHPATPEHGFPFFPPHCSCYLFLRLKPRRERRSPCSATARQFKLNALLSASPHSLRVFLLLCPVNSRSVRGTTVSRLNNCPAQQGEFSVVTLVPCPRHTDLISCKWFLPFKFFLSDVGSQFLFPFCNFNIETLIRCSIYHSFRQELSSNKFWVMALKYKVVAVLATGCSFLYFLK